MIINQFAVSSKYDLNLVQFRSKFGQKLVNNRSKMGPKSIKNRPNWVSEALLEHLGLVSGNLGPPAEGYREGEET